MWTQSAKHELSQCRHTYSYHLWGFEIEKVLTNLTMKHWNGSDINLKMLKYFVPSLKKKNYFCINWINTAWENILVNSIVYSKRIWGIVPGTRWVFFYENSRRKKNSHASVPFSPAIRYSGKSYSHSTSDSLVYSEHHHHNITRKLTDLLSILARIALVHVISPNQQPRLELERNRGAPRGPLIP
jgi:hypothetical protein